MKDVRPVCSSLIRGKWGIKCVFIMNKAEGENRYYQNKRYRDLTASTLDAKVNYIVEIAKLQFLINSFRFEYLVD